MKNLPTHVLREISLCIPQNHLRVVRGHVIIIAICRYYKIIARDNRIIT